MADTQGGIGYLIQQALNNRLARHGEKKAVTVVTQVEVDKNDPGFAHPPSPLVHSSVKASVTNYKRQTLTGVLLKMPDGAIAAWSPRRNRNVLSAPPSRAGEIQQGFVVIGAGGGGIPVVRTEAGDYQSVDAVIDKDLSTALLVAVKFTPTFW